MKRKEWLSLITCLLLLGISIAACGVPDSSRSVVIYTSVDQVYSEPILKKFEEETGIQVLPVYDVEAAKTTGLVNRLIAERNNPQADVFWNGEFVQTILLKEEGVLAPYISQNAAAISAAYIDEEGYWVGFAGRARVFIVNTNLIESNEYPQSIFDMLDPERTADKIGIAYPLFGTTATHAAAIYATLGTESGRQFFEQLYDRGIRVVDGNSVVRDLVASGQLVFGLTDTDDACSAVKAGSPVGIVFPDQDENALGTLFIPNTVALISNAPHEREAIELIDYLLSDTVAEALIRSGWSHITLRPVAAQSTCLQQISIKGMDVNLEEIYKQLKLSKTELTEIFVR